MLVRFAAAGLCHWDDHLRTGDNASRTIAARGQIAWDAGVSHVPLPLPVTGKGWTRQPASPPVLP